MAKAAGQTLKRTRTCIACGEQDDKRVLMRIVRTADGGISYDPSGRLAGRGAYVCSGACLMNAAKGNRLARALRTNVTEEDYTRIAGELDAPGGPVEG